MPSPIARQRLGRSRAIALCVALVAALASSACVRGRRSAANASEPPWLRWTVDRWTWDARSACREDSCAPLASLSMRGLTALDAVSGTSGGYTVVPGLAEEWKVVGPLELRLTLRENVKWSDGSPLVASEVLSSWTRLITDCKKYPRASLLFPIAGARAACEGTGTAASVGIAAPDARTIVVQLARPAPRFLRALAHPALAPWRAGAWLGAFLPGEREKTGRWRFARNPLYAGSTPALGGVELRVEPSLSVRLEWMREGQVDLVDPIPDEATAWVQGWEAIADSERTALLFNVSKKPFGALAARRGFARALQSDELSRLLRWPNVATGALSGDLRRDPGPTASAASEAPHTPSLTPFARPSLAWNEGKLNESIAENLSMQWLATMNERVDTLGEIGGRLLATLNPALLVRSYSDDPYGVEPAVVGLVKFASEAPLRWKSKAIDAELEAYAQAASEPAVNAITARLEAVLIGEEILAFPLYVRGRAVLKAPRVSKLPAWPGGAWDFARAEISDPQV